MHILNFVIIDGRIADGPALVRELRALGVTAAEVNRLRLRLATLTGTRRAVLEVSARRGLACPTPVGARADGDHG